MGSGPCIAGPLSSTNTGLASTCARKRSPSSTVSSVSFASRAIVGLRAARGGGSQALQLVEAVERRDLVALRERRVVEDVVHEEIERATERHHRLPDVHELRRAGAEHPHAENRAA